MLVSKDVSITSPCCFAAVNYLQKPSQEELIEFRAVFTCHDAPSVLIDSGVVIFSDQAASVIFPLVAVL